MKWMMLNKYLINKWNYQEQQGTIQLDRNMPKVAGSLMWAEEIKQTIYTTNGTISIIRK